MRYTDPIAKSKTDTKIELPNTVVDSETLSAYRKLMVAVAVKQKLIYDSFNLDF